MNEDIKRYMKLLEGKVVSKDKKFSTLIETTEQTEETVKESSLAEQLVAMMEMEDDQTLE